MKYFVLQNDGQTTYIRGRQKICGLVCGCILFGCWLLAYAVWEQDVKSLHPSFDFQRNQKKEEKPKTDTWDEFVIMQQGCRIPGMTVFGPSVAGYLQTVTPEYCEYRNINKKNRRTINWLPPLVQATQNVLEVNKSALKFYGKEHIYCAYRSFQRKTVSPDDNAATADDDIEYSDNIRDLNITDQVTLNSESDEFIEVVCTEKAHSRKKKRRSTSFYRDYFAFVPLKKDVETRCDDFDRSSITDRISVMIIGLDALSRLNFHRRMISSVAYLNEKMDAIEMLGYNKIGDNTFPNLIPALAGMSVDELKKACWPSDGVFDGCPMIWKTFQDNGYRTIFAEDSPAIGAFNYQKHGFRQQPTDYYLRPFYIESEKHIGFNKPLNCFLCLGPRLSLSVLLDYARQHAETWGQKKFFGFFWSTSFTHDYFNLSPRGDEAVIQFLKSFHENNSAFNNTVLVLMSDHGLRWGEFRETYQGHLEERLPLLMFVFPPWFSRKYERAIQNLRRNAHMLTTHYDLHETLLELANLSGIENDEVGRRKVPENGRGQSLFLPVKETRTCSAAGIPKHYCTCHDKVEKLEANDTRAIKAADVLVSHVNNLLQDHRECAEMKLKSIEQASVEVSTMGGKFTLNQTLSNLMVTVKMIPGNGIFEATVRLEPNSNNYEVVGQVSRINTYGSQSFCIHDYVLKLYCYCKL